ncbi:MAG: ankyrin repeat domain-containing protein [Terracidiphilus sp.]
MRGQRWTPAILAMTMLALAAGCWGRAYERETGARLDGEYRGPRCCDTKVFVKEWDLTKVQMAAGSTSSQTFYTPGYASYNAQSHSWSTTPWVAHTTTTQAAPTAVGTYTILLKPVVEEKIRENGFAISDSSLLSDYYVVASSNNYLGHEPVGWFIWDLIVCAPACFAPVPVCFGNDQLVIVEVYDQKDRLVAGRVTVFQKRAYYLSLWSTIMENMSSHQDDVLARVAANAASEIIADEVQLGGDAAKIKALLKDNPNFVSRRGTNDDTPLHWATLKGQSDVMLLLLNNKADVNAKNKCGQTPLHVAALNERRDLVELLRQHGGHE